MLSGELDSLLYEAAEKLGYNTPALSSAGKRTTVKITRSFFDEGTLTLRFVLARNMGLDGVMCGCVRQLVLYRLQNDGVAPRDPLVMEFKINKH